MTDLARRYQRPHYPKRDPAAMLFGLMLLGVGGMGVFFTLVAIKDLEPAQFFKAIGLSLCAAVPGAGLLYIYAGGAPAHDAKVRQWKADVDYLERAWLCHRCGHDWDPDVD